MEYLLTFEKKNENDESNRLVDDFKKEYGTEIDSNFKPDQVKMLKKAFTKFDKNFIKGRIDKIILKDLGGVHGKWANKPKSKEMILNPSIFKLRRKFKNGSKEVPYNLFVLIHEIGHCVDHVERISYSKVWQSISGWKKWPRSKKVPEGYIRYIEKRPGRKAAGDKKSDWVHKDDADFCRKYASRNPREDFADCFAHGVLGLWNKFKGDGGEQKMAIIKDILTIV